MSGPTSVTLPAVAIDPLRAAVSRAARDRRGGRHGGGAASGWELRATATRWVLDGVPGQSSRRTRSPPPPAAPTTPVGSDLTGVGRGAGGVVHTSTPTTLMSASPGPGIGTYRQNPYLSRWSSRSPPSTVIYRCDITLAVS